MEPRHRTILFYYKAKRKKEKERGTEQMNAQTIEGKERSCGYSSVQVRCSSRGRQQLGKVHARILKCSSESCNIIYKQMNSINCLTNITECSKKISVILTCIFIIINEQNEAPAAA